MKIVWFRQDLRIADNPALFHAAQAGPLLPIFIYDANAADGAQAPLGAAGRWWLHHSLAALQQALPGLQLYAGNASEILPRLLKDHGADSVYWNRCYTPAAIERDTAMKTALQKQGVEVQSFNSHLLHEPWQISSKTGQPFKVFTPYWRAASTGAFEPPLPRPQKLSPAMAGEGGRLTDWALQPSRPNWAAGWRDLWTPGEAGATERLQYFLQNGLRGYGQLRDRPDLAHTSRLSAHLHFGEISPRQITKVLHHHRDADPTLAADVDKFLAEIGWREFSHHLLFHFPSMVKKNWRAAFDHYPWRDDLADLQAWQQGRTGYPIVDAGMRELWQTGTMHNRVRMVAASFLVKHLRLHWRKGEAWFRDTLLDADLANNVAGWQWVAGSGADAAPYFRIFNPITQGRKFDPDGNYVRRYCPELAQLDNTVIHAPFEATPMDLAAADVRLGDNYPLPIVDHKSARQAALQGYEKVKAGT